MNRVIAHKDPAGGITRYEYDSGDRIIKLTDPRGLVTSYVYDGFGQLWAQHSPDTGTTTYQYDAAGLMTKMTRNDGSWLAYNYNATGRMTYAGNHEWARYYSYDWCQNGKGKLCGYELGDATKTHVVTHFGYSPEGQITIRRDLDYIIGSDDWTGYSHDAMGRLVGISYPSGVNVGYGYSDGELTVVQATINGVTQNIATGLQYSPAGMLTRMTYGNGVVKERTYDLDGRLGVTHDHGMLGHSHFYDAADRIVSIQNWSRPQFNESYGYDALSRITSIASPQGDQAMSYTANGNRTQHNWWVPEGGYTAQVPFWVDPGSNRAHDQHIAVAFDGRGNRSSQHVDGSTATFSYDAFNRLRSVARDNAVSYASPGTRYTKTYPAGTTIYTVNAMDQRVAKTGPTGSSRFIYGGQTQLLAEASNGVWSSYIWLGSEPIAVVRNGQVYYLHNDHLGRPEIVTNQARQHIWVAANFAFDRHVAYNDFGELNLGFPGQYYDAETGFWHNGYRDYDSRSGAYLQSDPIGLAGGLNTYAYVGGNPVIFVDPLGLCEEEHEYVINQPTPCNAAAAFNAIKTPGISAPGAPAASTNREIVLFGNSGNNRITQIVDSNSMTITNITQERHQFHPGTVVWQVTPGPMGHGSMISVTGTGTGPNPEFNNAIGYAFFGPAAALAAILCTMPGG